MKCNASLGLTFEDEKGWQHFATCRDCRGKSDMLRLSGRSPEMYCPRSFDFEHLVAVVQEWDRHLVHIEDIIEVPTFQLSPGRFIAYKIMQWLFLAHDLFGGLMHNSLCVRAKNWLYWQIPLDGKKLISHYSNASEPFSNTSRCKLVYCAIRVYVLPFLWPADRKLSMRNFTFSCRFVTNSCIELLVPKISTFPPKL